MIWIYAINLENLINFNMCIIYNMSKWHYINLPVIDESIVETHYSDKKSILSLNINFKKYFLGERKGVAGDWDDSGRWIPTAFKYECFHKILGDKSELFKYIELFRFIYDKLINIRRYNDINYFAIIEILIQLKDKYKNITNEINEAGIINEAGKINEAGLKIKLINILYLFILSILKSNIDNPRSNIDNPRVELFNNKHTRQQGENCPSRTDFDELYNYLASRSRNYEKDFLIYKFFIDDLNIKIKEYNDKNNNKLNYVNSSFRNRWGGIIVMKI